MHFPMLIMQLTLLPFMLWPPGTSEPSFSFPFKNYLGSCDLYAGFNFLLWLSLPPSLYFIFSLHRYICTISSKSFVQCVGLESSELWPHEKLSLIFGEHGITQNTLKPMCFIYRTVTISPSQGRFRKRERPERVTIWCQNRCCTDTIFGLKEWKNGIKQAESINVGVQPGSQNFRWWEHQFYCSPS